MRYKKPFNELGFTTKCAIVESQQEPTEDADYKAFVTHATTRKRKHARDRKKILAGILKLQAQNTKSSCPDAATKSNNKPTG